MFGTPTNELTLEDEFWGAELGDLRRGRRLQRMVSDLGRDPAASLPELAGDDAALEACYRFLNNEEIEPAAIFAPHVRRTIERASEHEEVLVVHDTTTLKMSDTDGRRGLGPVADKKGRRGFFAHVSLAVCPSAAREPLGLVAVQTYVRPFEKPPRRKGRSLLEEDHEYRRWWTLAGMSAMTLEEVCSPIHVMDAEADIYELFALLLQDKQRFVIRASDDRATPTPVEGTKGYVRVSELVHELAIRAERTVLLSPRGSKRPPRTRKVHPSRKGREATLHFSATAITLKRPHELCKKLPATLTLNLVRAFESNPPEGQEPIEWRLWTTEPIETVEQILQIVDWYRARWTVEELFKALKTGCSFEKRQLRSYEALCRLLAIFLPIAWRLLRMRALARLKEPRSATDVLSETQLQILRATSRRVKLGPTPTAREVMRAVAGLGGHLKRNGEPGWITLGRGFDKLLEYELGWLAAMRASLPKNRSPSPEGLWPEISNTIRTAANKHE